MSLVEDPLGRIWIGSKEGINIFNPEENTFVHYENQTGTINPLISDKIWSLFVDQGGVWIGGHYGLTYVDLKRHSPDVEDAWIKGDLSNEFRAMPFIDPKLDAEKHQVRSIIKDHLGRLWVGTYYGLYVLELESDSLKILKHYLHDPLDIHTISNDIIISLLQDKKGDMWIGTRDGGLNHLILNTLGEGEHFTRHTAKPDLNSLANNEVSCIHEDRGGDLWIGTTGGGMTKLERNTNRETNIDTFTFFQYGEKEGLMGDEIFGILEDDNHNLWISTNQGIFKFDPQMEEGQKFKQFTKDHGLQGNMFFTGAYYKSLDGHMYFGGQKGFNVFHPDSIKENFYLPQIAITKLDIFNETVLVGETQKDRNVLTQPISETSEISLSHRANNFSLEFAALHYSSPENNRYAYQLEGYDEDWVYTNANRRYASYNNLKPGTYVFKVKASNADNVWNPEYARLIIQVGTPPWKSWWAIALYGLLLLGFLYTFRYYTLNKIRLENDLEIQHREHQKTKEMNQMKLNFFTQISHEFRTPLTLIIGPVQELVEKGKKLSKTEICRHLKLIDSNAKHLLRLIDQLLYFSKSEYGHMKYRTEQGDLIAFTQQVCDCFYYLAQKKNIYLNFHTDHEELLICLDWDKIEKILNNLLSNAIKFTPENGEIHFRIYIENGIFVSNSPVDGKINIEIQDTGVGIPAKQITRIFDSFYQASVEEHDLPIGYGIGLALTKKLVELHKGTIKVKSTEGIGTTFNIQLPYSSNTLESKEGNKIVENGHFLFENGDYAKRTADVDLNLSPILAQNKMGNFSQKPLILIVDDNPDIRTYLRKSLQDTYSVLEAENGKDGWKQALEYVPVIVISDIMMPIMDGNQLCELLKSDERTNHIPIILLTAKSAIEHKIEGLQAGADAYLAKPFHPRHLEVRIQKLIELRAKLREKYKTNIHAPIPNQEILSEDEVFLQKVSTIIERHLIDTDFKVNQLEHELGMSHMQLYRKLKALTDQSANEFIRSVRLNKAATLLKSSNLNVSEVAYQVGFNSPSYFIKCFRKEFGILPKVYGDRISKVESVKTLSIFLLP